MDPGASGPNGRDETHAARHRRPSRLRRSAPAISRQHRSTLRVRRPRARHPADRAPKAGGTAEGLDLSSRQWTEGRSDSAEVRQQRDDDDEPAQPGRGQAPGGQCRHHPPARQPRRRPGDTGRRVPAHGRRRPGLPARVGRGRRARRALLVPRRRPAAHAGGPGHDGAHRRAAAFRGRLPRRPAERDARGGRPHRRHPGLRAAPDGRAARGHAALHRRCRRRPGL